jgi:hypothetical protein
MRVNEGRKKGRASITMTYISLFILFNFKWIPDNGYHISGQISKLGAYKYIIVVLWERRVMLTKYYFLLFPRPVQ